MYLPMLAPPDALPAAPAPLFTASEVLPRSANSRKLFKPATPFEEVFARSIMPEVIVENTSISSRARETATFSRRQPPA